MIAKVLLIFISDARIIKYCGRRLLCHSKFQLYLSTPLAKPEFSPVTASMMTLVNYGSSNETLLDDLLTRSFACVRPDLYSEYRLALRNSDIIKHGLLEIMKFFHSRLDSKPAAGKNLSFHESDVDVISDLIQKTEQVCDILCYLLTHDSYSYLLYCRPFPDRNYDVYSIYLFIGYSMTTFLMAIISS